MTIAFPEKLSPISARMILSGMNGYLSQGLFQTFHQLFANIVLKVNE